MQQPRGQGDCNPPVKDRDILIEQSVTRINEAQVVYDKFMKQISTVRYKLQHYRHGKLQSTASSAPFN